MDKIVINGGTPLMGTVEISGGLCTGGKMAHLKAAGLKVLNCFFYVHKLHLLRNFISVPRIFN